MYSSMPFLIVLFSEAYQFHESVDKYITLYVIVVKLLMKFINVLSMEWNFIQHTIYDAYIAL